ncbi:hypothetical protein BH24ACT7_BH24ACT7_25890 [soil metagenome]
MTTEGAARSAVAADSDQGDATARIAKLREIIERANRLYYEQDAPELADADYDRLFRELVDLEAAAEQRERAEALRDGLIHGVHSLLLARQHSRARGHSTARSLIGQPPPWKDPITEPFPAR